MSTGGAWVTERKGWVVQLWASDRQGEFYSSLQLFARRVLSQVTRGLDWTSLDALTACELTLVVPVKLPLLPGKVLMFEKESSLWMTGVVGTTLVGVVGTTIVPPPAYTAAPQLLPPADNAGNEHFAALSSNFLPSHWEQASHLASNPLRESHWEQAPAAADWKAALMEHSAAGLPFFQAHPSTINSLCSI